MLFRIDPSVFCVEAAPAGAAAPAGYTNLEVLGLVSVVWILVGVAVMSYSYWQVCDDEAEGYIPDEWYARVQLLGLFLLGWPVVLYWSHQDAETQRMMDNYRTVGGRGFRE